MTVPDSPHDRLSVPGFLVNGVPKAGTHLLAKAVSLFPGVRQGSAHLVGDANFLVKALVLFPWIRRGGAHLGTSTLALFKERTDSVGVLVPIGVDWPHQVPIDAVRQTLRRLGGGRFATGHVPYSEELVALLADMGMKSLLILRDPRDVVISLTNYVVDRPNHFLHEFYQTLSESERIMYSIKGIEQRSSTTPGLLNIYERYQSVLPWISCELNHTTRFEDLVGPQGGGSLDAQIEELENIARHLNIRRDLQDIKQVSERLFGGTSTFRKGMIGNWRGHFSEEHRNAFKEAAGQLLLELGYEPGYDW
jgi:hypothetical protein